MALVCMAESGAGVAGTNLAGLLKGQLFKSAHSVSLKSHF